MGCGNAEDIFFKFFLWVKLDAKKNRCKITCKSREKFCSRTWDNSQNHNKGGDLPTLIWKKIHLKTSRIISWSWKKNYIRVISCLNCYPTATYITRSFLIHSEPWGLWISGGYFFTKERHKNIKRPILKCAKMCHLCKFFV